jgi:hypothetical protein
MKNLLLAAVALILSLQTIAQTQLPAKQIAGNWSADASFTSTLQTNPAANYFWVGKTWGRIEESGKAQFTSESGCSFVGLLNKSLYGSRYINGQAQVTGCKNEQMNRVYRFRAIQTGDLIELELTNTVFIAYKQDNFQIVGTFKRV